MWQHLETLMSGVESHVEGETEGTHGMDHITKYGGESCLEREYKGMQIFFSFQRRLLISNQLKSLFLCLPLISVLYKTLTSLSFCLVQWQNESQQWWQLTIFETLLEALKLSWEKKTKLLILCKLLEEQEDPIDSGGHWGIHSDGD